MGDAESSYADTETCLNLYSKSVEGYLRKGAALNFVQKYDDAIARFSQRLWCPQFPRC